MDNERMNAIYFINELLAAPSNNNNSNKNTE